MRFRGLFIIVLSLIVPFTQFIGMSGEYSIFPLLSQYFGATALIMMAFALLLSTRLPVLESLFGGLDRIYILHKWLGIGAIAVLFLHGNIIDAEIGELEEGWLSELGESLGGTSFDLLQILVLITLILLIPYRFWRWTHQFIGILYMLAAIHFWLVPKPFSLSSGLGLYVSLFCLMGIVSYLFTVLPISKWRMSYRYQVKSIIRVGDAASIVCEPIGRGLQHRPGQFAFISFGQDHLKEIHPFTISQAPTQERQLRFSIKSLGDYTKRVFDELQPGVSLDVSAAYGHFQLKQVKQQQIWVAAGVGITPFIAWAQSLPQGQKVHLFYCIASAEKAIHLDELALIEQQYPDFHLHVFDSSKKERLTLDHIVEAAKPDWSSVSFAFCGPKLMRNELRQACLDKGLPASRFHYEEFELRTGVGLDRLLLWLFSKAKEYAPDLVSMLQDKSLQLFSWINKKT